MRVFVLGLDGATWDLLQGWAEAGQLPTLRRLMREGAWGPLRSVSPPITAPAWTSFYTGTNPGKHGIYDFIRRQRDSYGVVPVNASERRDPSFFRLLSNAGKRVGVLNAPAAYPPEPVNGYLVTGFMTPPGSDNFTHPPGFGRELSQAIGGYDVWPLETSHARGRELELLQRARELVRQQSRALEYLVSKLPDWDFLMLQVQITDTLQHVLWKYMDPDHPRHDPASPEGLKNGILTCYRDIDEWFGEFLSRLGDDTAVIVVSDHGFGPMVGYIHVNAWLRRRGWLRLRRTPPTLAKRALYALGLSPVNFYRLAFRLGLGRSTARAIRTRKALVTRLVDTLFLSFADVDWRRTRAYSLGNVGPIFVNLKGREPAGTVEPGAEYEQVLGQLATDLLEMRDPQTGGPAVAEVRLQRDMYSGHDLALAPDIMFFSREMKLAAYGDTQFASLDPLAPPHDDWSGAHREDGVLLLHGPGVATGKELPRRSIMDLAPTILALLGVPVPSHMDGRPLEEAFQDGYLQRCGLSYVESAGGPEPEAYEYSDEEAEEVRKRLEQLGYLG